VFYLYEIRLSKEFNKDYIKIQNKAEKGNNEERYILNLIAKATAIIAGNKEAGIKIPKKQWPKEYVIKYQITNLWKYNLDKYWRLTYTIVGTEIEFFVIYLEVLDHPNYDKRFKYKKS